MPNTLIPLRRVIRVKIRLRVRVDPTLIPLRLAIRVRTLTPLRIRIDPRSSL